MPSLSKISKNNTTVTPRADGSVVVTLHQTEIVKVFPTHIELDTGGWLTATTIMRMQQVCREMNLGWTVSRAGGKLTAYPWANTDAPIKSANGRTLTLPRPCRS